MLDTGISIKLYTFAELAEIAQQKAITEHRQFMLETMQPSDFISGCAEYDTPEQLADQYNSEWNYIAENDAPVIESIEANEYLFFVNGAMAHIFYTFQNGKERITCLKLHGTDYTIKIEPYSYTPV